MGGKRWAKHGETATPGVSASRTATCNVTSLLDDVSLGGVGGWREESGWKAVGETWGDCDTRCECLPSGNVQCDISTGRCKSLSPVRGEWRVEGWWVGCW